MNAPNKLEWRPDPSSWPLVVICWALVGIPLVWGIYNTVLTAAKLLR